MLVLKLRIHRVADLRDPPVNDIHVSLNNRITLSVDNRFLTALSPADSKLRRTVAILSAPEGLRA